jgi:chemotaxis protein CheY-P-specific phosphatase CheC
MTTQRQIRDATLVRLRVLSEHSLQRAGHSLTALLKHPVRLAVAGITEVAPDALPALLAAADGGVMTGLRFQIAGETGGQIIILLPLRTIFRMLRALLGTQEEPRSLSDQEKSAVQEVGNIVVSSFLSGLGDLLGKRLMPTPPEIHMNDHAGLMRQVMADLEGQGSVVLVVRALFEDPEQRIEGQFFVLPEMMSLEAMLHPTDGAGRSGA